MGDSKGGILQFIRFGFVGVINTVVDWVCTYGALYFCHNRYISNGFGFLAGTFNSYLLNKKWTFKNQKNQRDNDSVKLLKFFMLGFFCFGISQLILKILEHEPFILQKSVSTLVVTLLNFSGSKFWVFRQKK